MTLNQALAACETLIAFATALQAVELLSIRKEWSGNGPWRWEVSRQGLPSWLAFVLHPFLSNRGFRWLLYSQLIASAFVLVFAFDFPLMPLLTGWLAMSCLLTSLRWRGAFNGASDAMTFWILALVSCATESANEAGQYLKGLAALAIASFFVSGLSKLRQPSWRSGQALAKLLAYSNYREPNALPAWIQSRIVAWLVLAFEITFPVCLVGKPLALLYIGLAVIFHFVNFFVFGLNRFFFVWISAYPAVYLFAR